MSRKPAVAIVGAGSLATSLAAALNESGHPITEIVCRDSSSSRQRARKLALRIGAKIVSTSQGEITAPVVWFCVPDREIRAAALAFANLHRTKIGQFGSPLHLCVPRGKRFPSAPKKNVLRFAFHSSGALPSAELAELKKIGFAVASVHPLMTFVPGSKPSLAGVPFALEGDPAAIRLARQIVRNLGGESFSLPASRKAAYHAWATMTSPLLLAFLATLEEAARVAGLEPADARRMSLPIIQQTLANYERLGPAHSFSGPIIRGDVETVVRHLKILAKDPAAREVYVSLARSAIRNLPAKNRGQLKSLLK